MKTIYCLVMLVIWGAITDFLLVIVLNPAGIPGALLAGIHGKRSKKRFILGSIVSTLGQSYVYLAFVAFVVNWTSLAVKREEVVGFLLWIVSFLVVFFPIWFNLFHARVEAQEFEDPSPQVVALHFTTFIAIVGFFVFAFAPTVMHFAWSWIPYMQ